MSVNSEQSDESQVDGLAQQLAEANHRISRMSQELDDLQIEQRLTHKLVEAGAVDLETAVLVAKARMEGKDETAVGNCIARLRKEKSYLFGTSPETTSTRKTAGAKDRVAHNQAVLEQAAAKAARSGSRLDLLRYLKLRRNLV